MRSAKGFTKAIVCIAALALSFAQSASAQVIFQREALVIAPPQTSAPKPQQKNAKSSPERTAQELTVEVRGEEALQLEYIHTLNDLGERDGVMIVFNVPSIVAVPTMKVYKPVDVLFIGEDGEVLQILPSIVPADIMRDIEADVPVRAFLYLKAGAAKALAIRPGDVASHAAFNAKPLIIR